VIGEWLRSFNGTALVFAGIATVLCGAFIAMWIYGSDFDDNHPSKKFPKD